jgi:hypothetical protein
MPNYQNGKIYKIDVDGDLYIGSTTQPLSQRKTSHVRDTHKVRNHKWDFPLYNAIK